MLMKPNIVAVEKIKKLKDRRDRRQITEEYYKEEVSKIKRDKNGQVVIIKPSDQSTWQNLIDALDEMAICAIGIYAIDDLTPGDEYLIKNLESGGQLAQQSDFNAKK
jgi:hypothetical protein